MTNLEALNKLRKLPKLDSNYEYKATKEGGLQVWEIDSNEYRWIYKHFEQFRQDFQQNQQLKDIVAPGGEPFDYTKHTCPIRALKVIKPLPKLKFNATYHYFDARTFEIGIHSRKGQIILFKNFEAFVNNDLMYDPQYYTDFTNVDLKEFYEELEKDHS